MANRRRIRLRAQRVIEAATDDANYSVIQTYAGRQVVQHNTTNLYGTRWFGKREGNVATIALARQHIDFINKFAPNTAI